MWSTCAVSCLGHWTPSLLWSMEMIPSFGGVCYAGKGISALQKIGVLTRNGSFRQDFGHRMMVLKVPTKWFKKKNVKVLDWTSQSLDQNCKMNWTVNWTNEVFLKCFSADKTKWDTPVLSGGTSTDSLRLINTSINYHYHYCDITIYIVSLTKHREYLNWAEISTFLQKWTESCNAFIMSKWWMSFINCL